MANITDLIKAGFTPSSPSLQRTLTNIVEPIVTQVNKAQTTSNTTTTNKGGTTSKTSDKSSSWEEEPQIPPDEPISDPVHLPEDDPTKDTNPVIDALSYVFPPLKLVQIGTDLSQEYPETVQAIPQTIAEAIFPATPLITHDVPFTTAQTALFNDTKNQNINAMKQANVPEEAIQKYDTTVVAPVIDMPSIIPDFSKIKDYLIVGAVALGGLFLLGKYIGRSKK